MIVVIGSGSVAMLTDARFSGVSTGACMDHIGPEGLAGGPIGKVRNGDIIEMVVDRQRLTGSINLVRTADEDLTLMEAEQLLQARSTHPDLPDDTRLWAALQQASGSIWAGCVFDVDKIIETLEAGQQALGRSPSP